MYGRNERPMPNTDNKIFLRDKNCNDRIYTYLLLKSKRNPNGRETHRYVEKMTNIQIANDLGITRATVGARMKDLKMRGFVIEEGRYYLVPKTDYYELIPVDTLDFLLNYFGKEDKLIKLYIVLHDYYNKISKSKKPKTFTMTDLHIELGYQLDNGAPRSKNSAHIRKLLGLLEAAGLTKITIMEGRNKKGALIDVYSIDFINSNVTEKYKESYKRLIETGEITPEWEEMI